MSITITLEEATANLPEIIRKLAPGAEVVITQNSQPVAELRGVCSSAPQPQFGSCRGMLTIVEEDDEHLADFRDYMS